VAAGGRPAGVPDILLLNLAGTPRGDAPPVSLSGTTAPNGATTAAQWTSTRRAKTWSTPTPVEHTSIGGPVIGAAPRRSSTAWRGGAGRRSPGLSSRASSRVGSRRRARAADSSLRAWHSLLDLAEQQAITGVGPALYPVRVAECDSRPSLAYLGSRARLLLHIWVFPTRHFVRRQTWQREVQRSPSWGTPGGRPRSRRRHPGAVVSAAFRIPRRHQ